jgi:hypothetical protein
MSQLNIKLAEGQANSLSPVGLRVEERGPKDWTQVGLAVGCVFLNVKLQFEGAWDNFYG